MRWRLCHGLRQQPTLIRDRLQTHVAILAIGAQRHGPALHEIGGRYPASQRVIT